MIVTSIDINTTHAIVIGGSIAGLLNARVLSDYFDAVTVIERDKLPDSPTFRGGAPQSRHLHALLAGAQQIMEDLFPGLTNELEITGAPTGIWGLDTAVCTTGGWVGSFDSGIRTNSTSRISLEFLIRRRVQNLDNVEFLAQTEVDGLLRDATGSVVKGVQTRSRIDGQTDNLYGDLVVDASGRRSKAPEWLEAIGYQAPEVTIINAHVGYATRWYQLPEDSMMKTSTIVQPNADEGLYRGGGWMKTEGNRFVVTLLGANGDYPPTDPDGFMEFAHSLAVPEIYELIKDAEPISPVYGYRKLENQQRHYERLNRHLENFLVTGDAACALNPIYGQGMTAASLEAIELQKLLDVYPVGNQRGLARAFQRKLHQVTRGAWLMSTLEDMRYPSVEGANKDLKTRISHWYFDKIAQVMPVDDKVTLAFYESMNLLKKPGRRLMHPGVMLRVSMHLLRAAFRRQTKESETTNPVPA